MTLQALLPFIFCDLKQMLFVASKIWSLGLKLRLVISYDLYVQTEEGNISEATEQAIWWRTVLLILARGVEWGNACHYPLKGHRQGKEMMKGKGQVYLAWGTRHTGLQGKDQENLTGVLWWWLWPLYTTTVFVHVYTRSPIQDKRDYCYWSSTAVSHSESEIRTSIAIEWKQGED